MELAPADDLSGWGALLEFTGYGAKHILLGYDHLLFLFGLALLSRGWRDVAGIAGLFALSYSFTLIGGTLLGIEVPGGVVEPLIALSVGFVGLQVAFGREGARLSRDPRPAALAFGLAHGLGLSSLVQELRLPGDDLLPSAIGFNLGVELGQLVALAAFIGVIQLLRAFPLPVRERIPAGFALMSASSVLLVFAGFGVSPAHAHDANPPPPPDKPATDPDPIPEDDAGLYHSRITAIKPPVPGLEARIIGGDERIEMTYTGRVPLVIEGTQGEPMIRLSTAGVEVNTRSPSVYLSSARYAELGVPAEADAAAAPRWQLLDSPGSFAWYEHRSHWMQSDRPPIVGDGSEPVTIFHWNVQAQLGSQPVTVIGVLDWIPDPDAVRAERSEVKGELLTALILAVAMAIGAGIGVLVRGRLDPAGAA